MSIFLTILAIIIIAGAVWLMMQPANYEVVRCRVINVAPDEVYSNVVDLKKWSKWNPWIMHEPDTPLEFGGQTDAAKGWYSWNGQYIGSGKMTHISMIENQSIEQALEFYKPMKSKCEVYWRFSPVGELTEVTWGMRGRMPFLFRWMSKMMDQWVGKDYEIGLARLAVISGDAEDAYEIEFPGTVEAQPADYIASHYVGPINEMADAMKKGFPKVIMAAVENGMKIDGAPFTLYHDFDMKSGKVVCDIAVPVDNLKEVDGFITGSLLAQKYMRTSLRGDYKHLEAAWHSAFSHARMFKQKIQVGKPMLERYLTDPAEASGLELQTVIDLPLK